jgi:hypothetical protein
LGLFKNRFTGFEPLLLLLLLVACVDNSLFDEDAAGESDEEVALVASGVFVEEAVVEGDDGATCW